MPQPVTPNDQSYFRQWGPHSIGMDRVWSLVNWVKNPEHDSRASGLGFSGQDAGEIIVAVLDTGRPLGAC